MKNFVKKYLFGIVSLAVALMVATGSIVSIYNAASAENTSATVTEGATVCASPFTEAVQKVRSSVVGVNNYITYSNRNNGYGYGFGYGYGYGYGYGNDYGYDYGNGNNDSTQDNSRQVLYGSGSGVVVAKGYVLTNYHVVENASALEITTDTQTYSATVAAYDESLDVAVLYAPDLDLEPVVLGDSDTVNVGDWAICIGNPLSFTGTTTVGVISGLNREVSSDTTDAYGKKTINTLIQTDAAINSGNSGGGMFNTAGELIGIPCMKYTGSAFSTVDVDNIGMAIPINSAKALIYQAVSGETNTNNGTDNASGDQAADNGNSSITSNNKPRIGVTVANLNSSNYAVSNGLIPTGAYVVNVEEGSPAATSGIQEGDIIVEVDGTVVKTSTEMVSLLQEKNAGDTVSIKLYRVDGGLNNVQSYNDFPDGQYLDVTVTLQILDNDQAVQQ